MKRKSLPTGRDFLFVEGYGNENPGAFQSTRPLRGATSDHPWRNLWAWVFQPTRPLRGATGVRRVCIRTTLISTHAPLAGRDLSFPWLNVNIVYFNPRAPCGARLKQQGYNKKNKTFQPTRPLRGATRRIDLCFDVIIFQPTRPLRGATDAQAAAGEGQTKFQPTRPLRGATTSGQVS